MNKNWIDGLKEIAAGMLFNGGYLRAPVQPARNDDRVETRADRAHADAKTARTSVTPLSALRPLPR